MFEHDSGRQSINPLKARFNASISRSAGPAPVAPQLAETLSPAAGLRRRPAGGFPPSGVEEGGVLSSPRLWRAVWLPQRGTPCAGQCHPMRPPGAANQKLRPGSTRKGLCPTPTSLGCSQFSCPPPPAPQCLPWMGRPGGWLRLNDGQARRRPHLPLEDHGNLQVALCRGPPRRRKTMEQKASLAREAAAGGSRRARNGKGGVCLRNPAELRSARPGGPGLSAHE